MTELKRNWKFIKKKDRSNNNRTLSKIEMRVEKRKNLRHVKKKRNKCSMNRSKKNMRRLSFRRSKRKKTPRDKRKLTIENLENKRRKKQMKKLNLEFNL